MIVEAVELSWLDLHLKVAHRTSYGSDTDRPVIYARVVTDVGEGVGECAAFAEPTYTDEWTGGAWGVLARHLAGRLLRAGPLGPEPRSGNWLAVAASVAGALSGVEGHRMAKATLEMAVLDAWLRAGDSSLADALGVEATTVESGCVVGTRDRIDELLAEVEAQVAAGYRRVKLKIAPGWDLEPARAVRAAFPAVGLQLDANGAYGAGDVERLAGLDALGLLCLEQPVPADDLLSAAAFRRRLETPVCLDESITSPARLEEALALGACDVVCVKPGRLGGFGPAMDVVERGRSAGLGLWCGGMLETGLARAANAALAGVEGFTLPGDLGGGDRFVEGDPAGALEVDRGRVEVYRGPGVGPRPSERSIDASCIRRLWIDGRGGAGFC